jgi:hypothetical protein
MRSIYYCFVFLFLLLHEYKCVFFDALLMCRRVIAAEVPGQCQQDLLPQGRA